LLGVLSEDSVNGGNFFPPDTNYQVKLCNDLANTVLTAKGIDGLKIMDIVPATVSIANNQVTIQNRYFNDKTLSASLAPGVSTKKDTSPINNAYKTVLMWKQGDENIELNISMSCALDSPNDISTCITLTNGKINKATASYNQKSTLSIPLDIVYTTPTGGSGHIVGKLLYEAKSGTIDAAEVICSALCITTKEGFNMGILGSALSEKDKEEPALRNCNYTCENGISGAVASQCQTASCSEEGNNLTTTTTGIPQNIVCNIVSNDFSNLPSLTVTLDS
jgi:hypothetical protein